MKRSISFVIVVLILGLFIGAVAGSLISRVFGLAFLDHALIGPFTVANDFYVIKNLELQLTPASLLGLVIAGWLVYRSKE